MPYRSDHHHTFRRGDWLIRSGKSEEKKDTKKKVKGGENEAASSMLCEMGKMLRNAWWLKHGVNIVDMVTSFLLHPCRLSLRSRSRSVTIQSSPKTSCLLYYPAVSYAHHNTNAEAGSSNLDFSVSRAYASSHKNPAMWLSGRRSGTLEICRQ